MLVKSYNKYILLLVKAMKQNSNKALSHAQLAGFIRRYHLDTDWKIALSEVKTDMKTSCSVWSKQHPYRQSLK